MGLAVNWAASPNTTGYVLYRNAGSPVNLASPPADKVEVAGDVTSYTYPSGVNNTIYYILVGAKKADGTITYSDQIQSGYFPDSGPGPVNLLRGDWNFGYFGEVPVTELFAVSEMYQALLAAIGTANVISPSASPTINTYHKVIVAGRILFFPDQIYSGGTVTPASLITNKLIVVDGDYQNKGLVVSKNGYDFVLRVPHANLTGVSSPALPNYDGVYQTELGMMFSLFGNTVGVVPPVGAGVVSYAKYRLADLAPGAWVVTPWTTSIGAAAQYVYANLSTNSISYTASTSGRPYLVLELLF